jgi:hypothetical protein
MPITIDISKEEYDSVDVKMNTRSTNLRRTRSSSNVRVSNTHIGEHSQNNQANNDNMPPRTMTPTFQEFIYKGKNKSSRQKLVSPGGHLAGGLNKVRQLSIEDMVVESIIEAEDTLHN